MYSWGDSMSDWARPEGYSFDEARKAARAGDAEKAKAAGGRTYTHRSRPESALTDPRKKISTKSPTPLVVAIDVTGSMARWPFEIFDRLPLLYQTLSQYRPELEVAFAAIGDAYVDRHPLQVTDFARGFELDARVKALYGEGGGGDEPESYGLFAHYMASRVETPSVVESAEKPFLIVFGDASMHPKVTVPEARDILGLQLEKPVSSLEAWHAVAARWNVHFLRRPGGKRGDAVHEQWAAAIGEQRILYVDEEARGVDYALGLIARSWGRFDDFQVNMAARQETGKVKKLANSLLAVPDTTAGALVKPGAIPDTRPAA